MEQSKRHHSRFTRLLSHGAGFLSGLMLTVSLIIFSLLILLTSTGLFHRALTNSVQWEAMEIPQEDLRAFAEETMEYFRGSKPCWQPVIRTGSGLLPVAESFTLHMETVKNGIQSALVLACILSSAALLLLAASFLLLPCGFSSKGYLAGLLCPFLLAGAVVIAAMIDFQDLWFWLHQRFIPDGIFSAGEPIMRMFPLSLFFSYIIPLLLLLAAALILLLIPLLASRKKFRKKQSRYS